MSLHQYEEEINIFLQFTFATNLADWDQKAKEYIYTKYTDDALIEPVPYLCDKLYWIGASELYGQPSDCKESEDILMEFIGLLHNHHIPVPDLAAYSAHVLNSLTATDDYFGAPFMSPGL